MGMICFLTGSTSILLLGVYSLPCPGMFALFYDVTNSKSLTKWCMFIYTAHEYMQRVLQNRLIEEELGDRAGKETATFGNGMV